MANVTGYGAPSKTVGSATWLALDKRTEKLGIPFSRPYPHTPLDDDDDHLDAFVDTLVQRLASFDREVLAAAKAQINRFGTPTVTQFQSSNDLFFPLLPHPSAKARRAKVRNIGYGVPSDFDLNFGRYLPTFGRTDEDTDKQPG